MNTDVLLRCFLAGASLQDLAALVDVPATTVEQLVRETLAHPLEAAVDETAPTPRPIVTGGRQRARQAGRQAGRQAAAGPRRRRSRDEITEAALTVLAQGPKTLTALQRATATTNRLLLGRLLTGLVAQQRVTLEGKVYHLVPGRSSK